jgi:ABC-type dipeptide/oligopeptide/nickel transport system permease component
MEVMREDYVRTARAKGLGEFQVMTQHVLRNALLPLSTMIAYALISLFEGSFFIETLTGVPGFGRLAFDRPRQHLHRHPVHVHRPEDQVWRARPLS